MDSAYFKTNLKLLIRRDCPVQPTLQTKANFILPEASLDPGRGGPPVVQAQNGGCLWCVRRRRSRWSGARLVDFTPGPGNPQTTLADGAYAWVVTAGDYIVDVGVNSNVGVPPPSYNPGSGDVLTIPSRVFDLDIPLVPLGGCTSDDFLGYKVKEAGGKFVKRTVLLVDQFMTGDFVVEKPDMLYNPADKEFLPGKANFNEVESPTIHLKSYKIKASKKDKKKGKKDKKFKLKGIQVLTVQFGNFVVEVEGPDRLLVPTAKALHPDIPQALPPGTFNHFLCYNVKKAKVKEKASIADQFGTADYKVDKATMLCNPVEKTVVDPNGDPDITTPVVDPNLHLMCFKVKGPKQDKKVNTNNQFGPETLRVKEPKELCVPAEKQIQIQTVCGPLSCIVADLNGDGRVDNFDKAILVALLGVNSGETGYREGLDLDANGSIGGADVEIVKAHIGATGIETAPTFFTGTVFDGLGNRLPGLRNSGAEEFGFEGVPYDFARTVSKNHGRIETRQCWVITDPACLDYIQHRQQWANLNAVVKVTAHREIGAQTSVQSRYYISSLAGQAKTLLEATRSHWSIENNLHWTLDVTFREDQSRVRKDHGPQNLAVLRQIALNLLKKESTLKRGIQGKRHKAGWVEDYLLKVLLA